MSAALIEWSLERVSERRGDPTAEIYARLLRDRPDLDALFVLDRQGGVRGSMLSHVFEVLLDMAGPRRFAANFVRSEWATHEAMGVSATDYVSFFHIVRDTVRDMLGEEWSADVDAAWRRVIGEIEAALAA